MKRQRKEVVVRGDEGCGEALQNYLKRNWLFVDWGYVLQRATLVWS
jgi:hypothetical protein